MNSELALLEYLGSAGIGTRIAADPLLNARIGDALGWVCRRLNVRGLIVRTGVIQLLRRQGSMSA